MKIEKCEMESGKIKGVNTNLILQEGMVYNLSAFVR
jgi:hypothetical protein